MIKSKTKIDKQLKKKTNNSLVETIINAKKKDAWVEVAGLLSGSRRKRMSPNLNEINEFSKEKDVVVVPGKVLSQGDINKKIKVVAIGFSERAKEKLLKAGCEVSLINQEIKLNPEAKGIKVMKK